MDNKLSALLTAEFTLSDELIYLNHAGVSPWPNRCRQAINQFASENTVFGSKNYPTWIQKETFLRQQIAELINAPSADDVALLKNTSEALSVVASGIDWRAGDTVIISSEEFPSNRIVWQALADSGVKLIQVDLHQNHPPEEALLAAVDNTTRLIAISSVQYSTGLRLNLEILGQFCKKNNILFCVDAIQSIGALEFDVQTIHADFVMADGHKWMLGPEGLGLFYCRADLRDQLKLHQYGWHMTEDYLNFVDQHWEPAHSARRFECGSPNMLGIHALSASLSLHQEIGMKIIESLVLEKSQLLFDAINASNNLGLITDSSKGRYGGIVTFRHNSGNHQKLYETLMGENVMCALRGGGIRYSPHFYTPDDKLLRAVEIADKF